MAAKKFKMAAAELKIGQNSPMHTLKLKFEAVVLTDCMFLAYDEEGVFKFEVSIPNEPIEIQDGHQKIKMAAKMLKYIAIFLLKAPQNSSLKL